MAYDITYNADFNILATITAPLFKSTDPNIKLDTNATLSLANLMASHINRRYKAVPTKVGAATVRLDRAYGSAPIQEFIKEKVANGYIYSVRFNVAWEIFGATIDVSSRIDKDHEDETGETFRGFTKEAATKFISAYVDDRERYDDYMGDCLNY